MSFDSQVRTDWTRPPSTYRSAPFWSWNSNLDPDRLCDAIASMHEAGMGGFFMHSRYGLKTPYLSKEWFECISACVAKAEELDMKAYLYDEDRWPSGAAGGLVTREHPEYGLRYLLACAPEDMPAEAEHVLLFAMQFDESGAMTAYEAIDSAADAPDGAEVMAFDAMPSPPSGWYNDGPYLDTMNADAVAEFIRVTHQAYADRYGKKFGTLIPAVFTDEPNFGRSVYKPAERRYELIWTPELPRTFRSRRGYDLRDHLPELIAQPAGTKFSKVRHDYYQTVTELFVENFSGQIGQWCGKHDIALTGHMLAEETLASQLMVGGAAMPHYEHMQWPGIDILGDQARELSTAKQCASVADQLGRRRVLSELYGCTGWDWPLEGHKFVGDWQFACGVNFRCPHLTHYSLAGGAKRDYPASIFSHSPWWKYYSSVEDYFGRLSLMLTQGVPIRDVLVIHPIQSAWGLYAPGSEDQVQALQAIEESWSSITRTLSDQHYDWDFGDESLLAKHAKATPKGLKVGQMTYQLVIVPPSYVLRSNTVKLLSQFVQGGGKVLFAGRQADHVDAVASDDVVELSARAAACDDAPEPLLAAVEALLPRRVSITEGGAEQTCLWTMLRQVDGGRLLFVQSHDRRCDHNLRVSVAGPGPVVAWDLMTGRRVRVPADTADGRVEFDLHLPPTGSALVSLALAVPDADEPAPARAVVATETVDGPWPIQRTEPNTLPLDYCRVRCEDGELSEPVPTLRADAMIREHFGLEPRANRGQQPWYLYATGVIDTAVRGPVEMIWTFHVTDVPVQCALAVERPEDYRITVNGQPAGEPDGTWVDREIRTIDITSQLQAGYSEIKLTFDYRPDMELEDMVLVGEFGVARTGDEAPAPGKVTLVAPPTELKAGSWVGQGLDFYGGGVRYRLTVAPPAEGRRVRVRLPQIACTAAAVHVGDQTFFLPWAPFEADITDAMADGPTEVTVEVIGGRKNILGPLHTPWRAWTGPGEFDPGRGDWTEAYQLVDHGLMTPVVVETLE